MEMGPPEWADRINTPGVLMSLIWKSSFQAYQILINVDPEFRKMKMGPPERAYRLNTLGNMMSLI